MGITSSGISGGDSIELIMSLNKSTATVRNLQCFGPFLGILGVMLQWFEHPSTPEGGTGRAPAGILTGWNSLEPVT